MSFHTGRISHRITGMMALAAVILTCLCSSAAVFSDGFLCLSAEAAVPPLLSSKTRSADSGTVRIQSAKPYMKIHVIDIGSGTRACGDATLLESDGEYLLIDTGSADCSSAVINTLKRKGISSLSLYISHYHADHCANAIKIMKEFHVKKIYLANPAPAKRYVNSHYKSHRRKLYNSCSACYSRYKNICSAARKRGVKTVHLEKGDTFRVGSVHAKVLWDHNSRGADAFDPYDKEGTGYLNNSSLVTKFTLGNRSFLTAGDIEASTERDLMASGANLSADIFKLNHHGIWSANTSAFVKAVDPCYIYYSYKNAADQERRKFGSASDVAPIINKLSGTYNILSSRYNGTIIYTIQNDYITVAMDRRFKAKKLKVRYDSSGKKTVQVLYYNDAQDLHLDKRMLIPGTTPVKETAADSSENHVGWKKTSSGWKYKTKKGKWLGPGWQTISRSIYFFTRKSVRHEGWLTLKGKRYFLSRLGILQKGWQMIDGKVYYFKKDGSMAKGKTRINGTVWPLRADGSLDLSKKNAPQTWILTVERRHTTK